MYYLFILDDLDLFVAQAGQELKSQVSMCWVFGCCCLGSDYNSTINCWIDGDGEARYRFCSRMSECVVNLLGEIKSITAVQGYNKHRKFNARELARGGRRRLLSSE